MRMEQKKSVSFKLDSIPENEVKANLRTTKSLFDRRPNFSTQRLFKSLASTSDSSMIIKENHNVDLNRLSVEQLEELLQNQKKIIDNKALLSRLKDKGEKAKAYYNKIEEAINLKKDIADVEFSMDNLTIEPKDNSGSKYHIVHKEVLEKILPEVKRFNQPKKLESTIKVKDLNRKVDSKDISVKISLPKEIQTLGLEESLKAMEATSQKEKGALKERLLNFYSHRSYGEDCYSGESEDDDEEWSDGENFCDSSKVALEL